MKPISPEAAALLASRQFYRADIYSFFLVGGGVLRYCGGDRDISYNGVLYPCGGVFSGAPTTTGGPYFDRKETRAKLHQKIGVETDQLIFDVVPGNALVNGQPFIQAAYSGAFDAATFRLDRAYMSVYGNTAAGGVNVFQGRVAEVDTGRSLVTFTCNSWLELLNLNFPRNLYQPGCVNNLGDTICGVNLAPFTVTGTAGVGSTNAVILASTPLPFAGYYDTGVITFTSGVLNGLARTARSVSAIAITLVGPFPVAPAAGDTFTLSAGCDKTSGLPISAGATLFSSINVTLDEATPGIVPGMPISGTGVPGGTTVVSINGNALVMSLAATLSGAETLTFAASPNGCAKFSNLPRRRGFDFIPQPLTAL